MISVKIPEPTCTQITGIPIALPRLLASLIQASPDKQLKLHLSDVCDVDGRILICFDSKTFEYVITFVEEAKPCP